MKISMPRNRRGFTLIELLMVIVIISILAALVLRVVRQIMISAERTREFAEITLLSSELNRFKERTGVYPPSRIRLREVPVAVASATTAGYGYRVVGSNPDQLDLHSVQYLERVFKGIRLRKDNTAGTACMDPGDPLGFEWFADGSDRFYDLEGDECLVFFLGGIAQVTGTWVATDDNWPDTYRGQYQIVMHGFSNNPTNPSHPPNVAYPQTLSRIAPGFEFKPDRLMIRTVGNSLIANPASNGRDFGVTTRTRKLPSYRSMYTTVNNQKPIAYFSSYEGKGYLPHDCDIPDPQSRDELIDYFQVTFPLISTTTAADTSTTFQHAVGSLGPNPYLQFDAVHPAPSYATVSTTAQLSKAHNAESFQLISPGKDGLYGFGGLLPPGTPFGANAPTYDNITNVTGGVIADGKVRE